MRKGGAKNKINIFSLITFLSKNLRKQKDQARKDLVFFKTNN